MIFNWNERILTLLIFSLSILVTSCSEEKTSGPENNFSYLENETDSSLRINPKDEPPDKLYLPSDSSFSVSCEKTNTELVGILNRIEYFGPPGYGNTPAKDVLLTGLVLKLQKDITISCENEKTIKSKEILLEVPSELNYEHLMGGTVIVRGQIGKSANKNPVFPVSMEVLRMDNLKPSMQ